MESSKNKIVEYADYCPICKYKDLPEEEDPCNECLTNPVNEDSHKPTEFTPKD